ncbi:MAG: hypothetical protein K0R54_243 [Clostridiaceae bacterium]|nr:hypothetical protein [Clostridiaceae bacterium]
MVKKLINFIIDDERKKSKNIRYQEFEHNLRNLLSELNDKTDREDDFLLDNIKQAIIVYLIKNESGENSKIFLANMKENYYISTKELVNKHPDLEIEILKMNLFVEDYVWS